MMAPTLLAMGSAAWLGMLTSVSPCPLATNVAAISYLGRFSASRRGQLAAGALYASGRAAAYTAVGAVLTWGLLSAPALSSFLQRHVNDLLGPVLVLVGMALVGLLPGLPSGPSLGTGAQERLARSGLLGSAALGFLFALAFCPVSAALFFGSLVPLAVKTESRLLLPALFGIGSAAPALAFALAIVIGRSAASSFLVRLRAVERWILPATGWTLVGVGVYLCFTRSLRWP